jgi:hypothetical protein
MKLNKKNRILKYLFIMIIVCLNANFLIAQTTISGTIKDKNGISVPFANVYIENTIDGVTSDVDGKFSLKTGEKGKQVLVISMLGYSDYSDTVYLNKQPVTIDAVLQEGDILIGEVQITAGIFETDDDEKVAILKPIDIYTNAGAAGDIARAIESLPGSQSVRNETGLFVRGGDASESVIYIDGMVVQNPFAGNVPGVSQRSRFSAFQFKGMAFSSGGYSARYGQALSSILELNTFDKPEESTINLNASLSGVAGSATKKLNNSSVECSGYYTDYSPFFSIASTNYDFYQVPKGVGGSARYVHENKYKGLLKVFMKHDQKTSGTKIPDPYQPGNIIAYGMDNTNSYFNTSYRQHAGDFVFKLSSSASSNFDENVWDTLPTKNDDWRIQCRGEILYYPFNKLNLLVGTEIQRYNFNKTFDTLEFMYNEFIPASYFEAEWKVNRYIAVKPGIRYENSDLIGASSLSPRIALAVKTGKNSQIAYAGGIYYQNANNRYLISGYRPEFQRTVHYIANYQWVTEESSFRIEGYYKAYSDLVREINSRYNSNTYRFISGQIDNSGNGYATGLDLFWKDKALNSNFDYWISYSYIDTKRLYENLPDKLTPVFVSDHNLNIVAKYFVEAWQLNIGVTYTYASGKPYYYYDINNTFSSGATPEYQNMSATLSYLTNIGKWFTVFYLSVDNITNRKNILGYRYTSNGQNKYSIEPAVHQWFMFGMNVSLTAFDSSEL